MTGIGMKKNMKNQKVSDEPKSVNIYYVRYFIVVF